MSGDGTEILYKPETSIEVQNVKPEPTYDHDISPETILECKMETADLKPDPLCAFSQPGPSAPSPRPVVASSPPGPSAPSPRPVVASSPPGPSAPAPGPVVASPPPGPSARSRRPRPKVRERLEPLLKTKKKV